MSAIVRTAPAIEDPTAALEAPPRGDDRRARAGELAPGRWLLWGEEAHELRAGVTHVGRGRGCGVRLEDDTVSTRHAIVVVRGSGVRVLDDASTNGTLVNGRAVDEAQLQDGDVVVLGRVVLTYRDLRVA